MQSAVPHAKSRSRCAFETTAVTLTIVLTLTNALQPGSQVTKALEKTYHLGCFRCAACDGPFPNGSFVPLEASDSTPQPLT